MLHAEAIRLINSSDVPRELQEPLRAQKIAEKTPGREDVFVIPQTVIHVRQAEAEQLVNDFKAFIKKQASLAIHANGNIEGIQLTTPNVGVADIVFENAQLFQAFRVFRFHCGKEKIADAFKAQLMELTKKGPQGQLLALELNKTLQACLRKITLDASHAEIRRSVKHFVQTTEFQIKKANGLIVPGWGERFIHAVIKALSMLFIGFGMMVGAIVGQGFANKAQRKKFHDTFFALPVSTSVEESTFTFSDQIDKVKFELENLRSMKSGLTAFQVNFNTRAKNDAQRQAREILNEVNWLHQLGAKMVGITYSANQEQTDTIIKTYQSGQWKTGTSGANQAAVIQYIERLLASEFQHLQTVYRTVPMTTMKYVEGAAMAADDESVSLSLQNADQFIADGGILLGWTNQLTEPGKLAIGGGVASVVQSEAQKQKIDDWIQNRFTLQQDDRTGPKIK